MKSFSNFLLEKKMSPGPRPDETATEKSILRNQNKKTVKTVKVGVEPVNRVSRKDAISGTGTSSYDLDDPTDVKNPNKKVQLDNTTKGGAVKTNKPQQKPLGKLIQRATQDQKSRGLQLGGIDKKDSGKLEAQRKARIDSRTGKATSKGVQNYAQNIGGYARKGRKLNKSEWERISSQAKTIASDPSSKAYKDIESKINKSDYAGKRAKVMNPKEVAQVDKAISKSKTINAKSAPLNVPNKILGVKTNSKIIDTPKRRLKIVNKGVNQADVSKVIAKQNKAYNAKRVQTVNPDLGSGKVKQSVKGPGSYTGSLSKGTLKFSGDANYQAAKKLDTLKGGKLNVPMSGNKVSLNTSTRKGKIFKPKKTVKQFVNQATGQTSLFQEKPPKDIKQGFRPNNTPDPNIIKQPKNYNPDQGVLDFNKKKPKVDNVVPLKQPKTEIKIDSKYKGPKFDTGSKIKIDTPPKSKLTSNTTGKINQTAWGQSRKTFKNFTSKIPKPIKAVGRVGGRVLGPALAVADGWGNYKGYKKQGYNTSGSIARSGAKTGAYWGGWAAGAKGGAALGATIGTAIAPGVGTAIGGALGGIAGGIAGGNIAGKVADWGIGAYDRVFGKQKLKDIKAKNVAKMNAKALKANPYKNAQPKISKSKTLTDKGNLTTITLKKGKDGSYILPKGYDWAGKASRVTKLTGRR